MCQKHPSTWYTWCTVPEGVRIQTHWLVSHMCLGVAAWCMDCLLCFARVCGGVAAKCIDCVFVASWLCVCVCLQLLIVLWAAVEDVMSFGATEVTVWVRSWWVWRRSALMSRYLITGLIRWFSWHLTKTTLLWCLKFTVLFRLCQRRQKYL